MAGMKGRGSRTSRPAAKNAEFDAISAEYARAIELIHSVREITGHPGEQRVRHWSAPASKVSADFFCTAEHRKNGWFGFFADAAGHGLASAIFALHTPALFRESVLLGMSLPAIYQRIDRFLIRQHIPGYYVCGVLVRIHGREVEILNAGMPEALLLDAAGQALQTFPSANLPFGVEEPGDGEAPVCRRYRMAREERGGLLIYSDGLAELRGPDGRSLGEAGVMAAVAGDEGEVFDRLLTHVTRPGAKSHDDISIVWAPVPMQATPEAEPEADHRERGGREHRPEDVAAALRIVEHFDRGLVLTDAEQRILYVNPAFTRITGYTLAEAVGQTPRLLSSGRQGKDFYRGMWQALLEDGAWSGEIWNRRKDGSLYLEWLDIRALHDETGATSNYLATFSVLTQHLRQQEQLRRLTLHDPVTGLANRFLLTDRGEQAMRRADRVGRALAVMFIDLDRFKTINDTLGHDIGDQVLKRAGERLASVLREDDTLSRFGGDQFVCLLADIARREDAVRIATKLLSVLEQPIEVDGHRFQIGASIGISAYPSDARQLDDLIVFAERAMARAKQAGGNIYQFFNAQMAVVAERQLEMEARLHAAIRNNELELHYQPKVDLHSRRIVGAEALVRWRDPKKGLVPPGSFIPVAEKSELIARIGSWVLQEACAAMARWDGQLPEHFQVAVNVSPMQLERGDLPSEVGSAVAASGIPPARLQIEVTESMFIRNAEDAAQMLGRVVDQGISVALDDFGTGYSNLGSLTSLPLDAFKLDQSFVRDVDSKMANSAIANAARHLADGLDKTVIAEGIETCSECRTMQALGYRIGQGYRFGKPLPEGDFIDFCQKWDSHECMSCPGKPESVSVPA